MPEQKEDPKYIDLLPVDNADPDGIYSAAITFALKNERIKNIALTGPYGAGKSSIIKTYEKANAKSEENPSGYTFLNISLAAFKEQEDNTHSKNKESGNAEGVDPEKEKEQHLLIERSILQQMIYRVAPEKLRYSRFRRITKPDKPLITSVLLVLWGCSLVYLYNNFFPLKPVLLSWHSTRVIFAAACALAVPTILLSDLIKSIHGTAFKKFSLKDGGVELGDVSEASLLNRHLDEIIYFFQETNYDIVVIEDLDRFGSPEIFVKLREINKLVNDATGLDKNIKFLYALKDDMFVHKNRTKFFDFIIPVVPIVNSSNSLEKMQERLNYEDLNGKVSEDFLRGVSLYIDDQRLINNIFNEFNVYYQKLASQTLNCTKLLAMMIYKNLCPQDFESLHHGKGALFEICQARNVLLQHLKNDIREEIEHIEGKISEIKNEELSSVEELINSYFGAIVTEIVDTGHSFYGVFIGGKLHPASQLKELTVFESLIGDEKIEFSTQNSTHYSYRKSIGKSFNDIQNEINPNQTFLERKENVESKGNLFLERLDEDKDKQVEKLHLVNRRKLNEILSESDFGVKAVAKKHKVSSEDLFVYLINEGFLDQDYHSYTSSFHGVLMTQNDREFLLSIQNREALDFSYEINTPKEVCKKMREVDFSSQYVLNINLIDYLLETKELGSKLKLVFEYISKNFDSTQDFFSSYYRVAKNNDKLVKGLTEFWPDFALSSRGTSNERAHIGWTIIFVDSEYIVSKMNRNRELTSFISNNIEIFLGPELKYLDGTQKLIDLGVKFSDLTPLKERDKFLRFCYENNLYRITYKNIELILEYFSKGLRGRKTKLHTSNLTLVKKSNCEHLKEYISENLEEYLTQVFLPLSENHSESIEVIRELLNDEYLGTELKKKIISSQECVFDSFINLPMELWKHFLLEERVIINWKNIELFYRTVEEFESTLTTLLNRELLVQKLSNTKIPTESFGRQESLSLSKFIFNNNEIDDQLYKELLKSLPWVFVRYSEDLSMNKVEAILDQEMLKLTEETFEVLGDEEELLGKLITNQIEEYFEHKEKYPIGDFVRTYILIQDKLSLPRKLLLINDMSLSWLSDNKLSTGLVADVFKEKDADISPFSDELKLLTIKNAKTEQVALQVLLKCIPQWDEEMTMQALCSLHEPYKGIASYGGKHPKLEASLINEELAEALESRNFISTAKRDKTGAIRIYPYNSPNHD